MLDQPASLVPQRQRVFVHQIYYDDASKSKLSPAFIPLDNTKNERPDWFEFWVILNFLRTHTLDDHAWYGFLSPRFREKTGFDPAFMIDLLTKFADKADVATFTVGWDQLAYFLNPWEQGEVWHPGLMQLSQEFLNSAGHDVKLDAVITDSMTSVLSNYIVAKKRFWIEWQALAEKLFARVEGSGSGDAIAASTSYGNPQNLQPMKVFIQERLATFLLLKGGYKVIAPDQSATGQIFPLLFNSDFRTRRMLQACDLMKTRYRETSDAEYLRMYWKIRQGISYRRAV